MRRARRAPRLGLGVIAGAALLAEPAHADGQSTEPTPEPALDGQDSSARGESPPSPLVAPKPSQGHFLALGTHAVTALAFDSERSDRAPTGGFGFSLSVGEAVTDSFDLGVQFALASTNGDPADRLTFGRFTLISQWYPTPGWFVRFGAGAGSSAGRDPFDEDADRGGYGDAYVFGVGAQLNLSSARQSGGWVLSPLIAVDVAPAGDFTRVASWVGLEVSYFTGLERDKLTLPVDEAYR